MKQTNIYIFLLLFLFFTGCQLKNEENKNNADSEPKLTSGPENGTLLIMGGGNSKMLYNKFMELAGGPDAPIIVIPTAQSSDYLDSTYLENYKKEFLNKGFLDVTVLHTRDTAEANTEKFISSIKRAKGVWFSGGRQWRHADSYLNTKTHEAFKGVLERGGVIGGSSAGATIQGSFLARGDSKTNLLPIGDHQEGLGFMTNVAIDQHVLPRNRLFDMFEILNEHPNLLGIGIDENTAIVVKKNKLKVIGSSYVAIYDGTIWSPDKDHIYTAKKGEKVFYLLKNGTEYDLIKRQIITFEDRSFIKLSANQLKKYEGIFKASGRNLRMSFAIENDTLKIVQQWGSFKKYELYAESKTDFYNSQSLFKFQIEEDESIKKFSLPADERFSDNLVWERID